MSSCFREFSGTVWKPSFVSFLKFSSCLCVDETRPKLSFRAPHRAERLQPDSHVVNIAATRESSFAKWLSQLPRALPGCCKIAGLSFEPLSLSLLCPRRCRGRRLLLLSADINVYGRDFSTRGFVICFGGGPGAGLLNGEAKSLPFLAHKHAL